MQSDRSTVQFWISHEAWIHSQHLRSFPPAAPNAQLTPETADALCVGGSPISPTANSQTRVKLHPGRPARARRLLSCPSLAGPSG